jgi:uncharacterized protein YprB with RNaseH-like and TPR domain
MEPGSDKISRLKQLTGVMSAREVFDRMADERTRRAAGEFEIEQVVPGAIVKNGSGQFFLVTHRVPVTHCHGNVALQSVRQTSGDTLALISNDQQLHTLDLQRAVFLDTETTGLAGGTGTYAFMVGVGFFDGEEFVLQQYFMRDYDEEEAMLLPLAELLEGAEAVVTYNGKAFDIPLLQTRFITARRRIALDDVPHLDLLHVARRLWRARLGDCSLANVERAVLGVIRQGDIASYLIPQLYFDYLRTRDARRLSAVFYHNQQDILSLIALLSRADRLVSAPPDLLEAPALDLLSLARLHFRHRKYHLAERLAAEAYDLGLDPDPARVALYVLALSLKRQHRWDEAHGVWRRLAQHWPEDVVSRVEMAKHLEHRRGDLPQALSVCEEILRIASTLEIAESRLGAFRYRLARIEYKLARLDNAPYRR